jgi:hypothetical protein
MRSTFDKDLFLIVHAVHTFRVVIHETSITVFSDHKPLKKVLLHPRKFSHWKMNLAPYGIPIKYRPVN